MTIEPDRDPQAHRAAQRAGMDQLPTYGNGPAFEIGASNSPPVSSLSSAELRRLQQIQQLHLRQGQQQAAYAAQSRQSPVLQASHPESQQHLQHMQKILQGRQAHSRGLPPTSRQPQSARQSTPPAVNGVSCSQPPRVLQQAACVRGQHPPLAAPAVPCKRRQGHPGKSPSQSPPLRGTLRWRVKAMTSGAPRTADTAARSLPYCRVPAAAASASGAAVNMAPPASAMASPKLSASTSSHSLVSHQLGAVFIRASALPLPLVISDFRLQESLE